MILIADSGGTKTEWCLVSGNEALARFTVLGMNAMMLSEEEMADRIASEVLPMIGEWIQSITNVYFYGAGCVSEAVCSQVSRAILRNIPDASVEVATDLLGTARALCGDLPGLPCILGTGSNSCYYDGVRIVDNVSPLGFILGDEGGGAYMGKTLVGDVLKRQLPPEVCKAFLEETGLDAVTIVQRVYREPYPNRFLASLTPFLSRHIDVPEVKDLVVRAFKAFFKRNVCLYTGHQDLKVSFSGSIAYYFRPQLEEAAADYGFTIGVVIQAPMDGLINYHANKKL